MKTSLQVRVCGGRAKTGDGSGRNHLTQFLPLLRALSDVKGSGGRGAGGLQRKSMAMVQVPRNLASNLNFSRGGEEAIEVWVPGNLSYLPVFQWLSSLGNSSSPEPHGPAEFLKGFHRKLPSGEI